MKRTLMIGVATGALLAGISFAGAQGYGQQQMPNASGGASVEQKGELKGKARGGAEMKTQGGAELKGGKARAQGEVNAQGEVKGKAKAKAKGDAELKAGTETKGGKARAQAQGSGEMKAQETQKPGMKGSTQSKEPSAAPSGGTSATGDMKAGGSATTGQAGTSAKTTLTTEQKTRVRETVFKSGPRVTNVNFSLSIGTVVPRTVRFAPLPPILVEYYPQWRGYEYFIVEEEIIIVEPRTLKIVAVIAV